MHQWVGIALFLVTAVVSGGAIIAKKVSENSDTLITLSETRFPSIKSETVNLNTDIKSFLDSLEKLGKGVSDHIKDILKKEFKIEDKED